MLALRYSPARCLGAVALMAGFLLGGPAAAEVPPEAVEAYNQGRELTTQGKLDEAVEKLRAALALDPSYAKAHLALGYALEQRGLLPEAREEYGRAGEADSTLTQAFSRRGTLALRAKAWVEAAASFGRAAANDSTLTDAYLGMGSAYAELRQDELAIPAMERAILLDPGNADSHYLLGMLYVRQTGTAEGSALARAGQEFAKFLEIAPQHVNAGMAHFYAGLIAFQTKKDEEALAHFDQAIALVPTMAEAYYRKAQTLARLSRQQDAIAALKEALALKPNYGAAHYQLALVYHRAQDVPNALAEYQAALKDPSFDQAANAKKAVASLEDYLKKKAEADKAAAPKKP